MFSRPPASARGSQASGLPQSREAARRSERRAAHGRVSSFPRLRHRPVDALLPGTASDAEIVEVALREGRTILTQDLDFSALVALSGRSGPSVVSLRISSSRVERVNQRLREVLPAVAAEIESGAIVSVEDDGVRARSLPIA